MVLLKNMRNSHRMGGKLEKKWLGPYEVVESLSKGRYTLKSSDGSILKKAYNGVLLKEYLQPFVVGIFTCRLNTTIYCFSPSGLTYKWIRHSPKDVSNRMSEKECIYLTNINSHFEIVRKI